MNEYMLLIRNQSSHLSALTPEEHQAFLNKVTDYIGNLMSQGKLKSAQPLIKQGKIVSGTKNAWKDGPFNETKEIIVGYYHILAKNMDEATEIAKSNPEFEYTTTARVEIRPIKIVEESTEYRYPQGK